MNINREDKPPLAALMPTFAIAAASTVVLASVSKALFLAENPIALLPWMFLGSAAITAVTSLIYVALMKRLGLASRFVGLLALALASFIALRATFPLAPQMLSVIALLWCPAIGHLVVVQTWNLASSLLPTRQGKRLFPVLAAVTTSGAALGGGLVQLAVGWLSAEDLLLLAAVLLAWPLVRVRSLVRKLTAQRPARASDLPPAMEAAPREAEDDHDGSEVMNGLRSIARRPLLSDLALFVFLLQAASLLVDYQFSAELQPRFDKNALASFLGSFYLASNLVVLVVTLFVTTRAVRVLGIGLTLAASGVAIALGSGAYVAAWLTGWASTFWVIAATAFGERIAQYALTKPAMQMLYMPLQTSGGERAKTLIDGLVYRVATAVVSVLLLVVSPTLASQFRLSPPAVLAGVVLLYVASRIGPHYRRAIFEALRARRIDANVTRYLAGGLARRELRELEKRLQSGDEVQMVRALEVARELSLPLDVELLESMASHDDERVAKAALATMDALDHQPSPALLARMLQPDRPPRVLRAVLSLLAEGASYELAEIVRPLTTHRDPGVASAACLLRIRAAGGDLEESMGAEITTGQRIDSSSSGLERITGQTRAGAFARELPELLLSEHSKTRQEVIEVMSQLALPHFIVPLIACLTQSDVRRRAIDALVAYGERAMPVVRENLGDDELALVARVSLLRVLEGVGSDEALALLLFACRSPDHALRDHAVEALFRLTVKEGAPQPRASALKELISDEIKRLKTHAAIEVMLGGIPTSRKLLFLSEVQSEGQRAEQRAFRALGMLYDRDAILRAYRNYRSSELQTRSNAIELLEQHIDDPALLEFVQLIERSEDKHGNLRPQSVVYQALAERHSVEQLLGDEPWLRRLWAWVSERDGGKRAVDWTDELDRVVVLKRLPLFRDSSGRGVLPIARQMPRREVAAGDALLEQGSEGDQVYWLLDGKAEVLVNERRVGVLSASDVFGEVGALDGGLRSATVRVVEDGTVLVLERAHFDDAIDLNPGLIHGLLGTLSRRVRDAWALHAKAGPA